MSISNIYSPNHHPGLRLFDIVFSSSYVLRYLVEMLRMRETDLEVLCHVFLGTREPESNCRCPGGSSE